MDPHPTPYPGKHRRAGSSINKVKTEGKTSKDPGVVPTRYKQYPQRRVFGTIRSTNVTLEDPLQKPQAVKASKPLRPSIASVKAVSRDGTHKVDVKKAAVSGIKDSNQKVDIRKKSTDSGGKGSNQKADSKKATGSGSKDSRKTSKSGIRKTTVVSFREPLQAEDEPCSPVPSSIKPLVLGTPYLSAQNCSKCRLDRLESASYWITQIKLAESVGKHFVSAAFFRLAIECRAEPSRRLRSELKSYTERHVLASNAWTDVCLLYGLSDSRSDDGTGDFSEAVPCVDFDSLNCSSNGVTCEYHKDEFLDSSVGDIVSMEEVPANPDPEAPQRKESVENEPFAETVNISTPALQEEEKPNSDPEVQELKENAKSESFTDAVSFAATINISTPALSEEEKPNSDPEVQELKEHVESGPLTDAANFSTLVVSVEEEAMNADPEVRKLKEYAESEPFANDISSQIISEEEKPVCPDPEVQELKESVENGSFDDAASNTENEDQGEKILSSIDGSPSIYKSCDALSAFHWDEFNASKDSSSKVKLPCKKDTYSSGGSSSTSPSKKHRPGGIVAKEGRMPLRNKSRAMPKPQIGEQTEKSRLGPKRGVEGKKQSKLYANKNMI